MKAAHGARKRNGHAPVPLTLLNGVTLGALYFLVASGFTLVFG